MIRHRPMVRMLRISCGGGIEIREVTKMIESDDSSTAGAWIEIYGEVACLLLLWSPRGARIEMILGVLRDRLVALAGGVD